MKSKAKIEKQLQRKIKKDLVNTILAAKKHKNWLEVAAILSGPRRKKKEANLEELDKKAKEGEILVIPGKVLSLGEINKKIKVVALNFSEKAREKLLKSGCDISYILDEIKKNPEAKKIKILK